MKIFGIKYYNISTHQETSIVTTSSSEFFLVTLRSQPIYLHRCMNNLNFGIQCMFITIKKNRKFSFFYSNLCTILIFTLCFAIHHFF